MPADRVHHGKPSVRHDPMAASSNGASTSSRQPVSGFSGGSAPARVKDFGEQLTFDHSDTDARRRAMRTLTHEKESGGFTGKNLLNATFTSNGENHTFHLRSAGMDMQDPHPHPRWEDRTASHTEPQMGGLLGNMRGMVRERTGQDAASKSVFSSLEACASKGGGTSQGCREMQAAKLGLQPGVPFYFGNPEQPADGKNITKHQMLTKYGEGIDQPTLRRHNSYDHFIDSDQLHGKNLDNIDLEGLKAISTTEGPDLPPPSNG